MKQAGTTTYLVNGLGQRVKKNNGSDLFFAYDEAGHLIGEYDSTGAPVEETVWLGDIPVAVIKPATPGFTVYYVWSDHLGTPRQITDTANQSRWEWAHNDPFANNLPNENPAGLGTFTYNLRFPGQYYDAETAKHYNYFRDYDPAIGRYVESDPLGVWANPNTYAYVLSDALLNIDPLGLLHYNAGPPRTVPVGGDTLKALQCTESCLQSQTNNSTLDLLITGGAEQKGHTKSSHHYKGEACDIAGPKFNPIADDQAKSCAAMCGFGAGQFEQFKKLQPEPLAFPASPRQWRRPASAHTFAIA